MRRPLASLFTIFSLAGAAPLAAQAPARAPGPTAGGAPIGAPGVEMLLSQTGALQLTDAQVVRLAAIARRAEDRHRALRTRLDSLRPRRVPGDTTARRERPAPPMDLFERERDASHTDLRDALSVLTADQQARAWEMIAARPAMPFGRGGMMRSEAPGRMRGRAGGASDGMRQPGGAGMTPRRPGDGNDQQR